MATRKLHQIPEMSPADSRLFHFFPTEETDERWNQALQAEDDDRSVAVVGVIGYPEWADGTTAKGVEARLKQLGSGDIAVNINSPGGDFFEGQAIYNLLRNHDGRVVVNVIGIAASAASVVAMAGDEIRIPKTAWFMIHNVWGITLGDKHDDLRSYNAKVKFDQVSADLYAERSRHPFREIVKMMDDETYLSGQEAVDKGFADSILAPDKVKSDGAKQKSAFDFARLEVMGWAKAAGKSRSDARATWAALQFGKPRAAVPDTLRAVDTVSLKAGFDQLKTALTGFGDVSFSAKD